MAKQHQLPSWLGKFKGAAKEADDRAALDARQRSGAEKIEKSIILTKKDILTGTWDAAKILKTTIGGKLRDITSDDLRAFQQNMKLLQEKVGEKGKDGELWLTGMTAKQVIDLSLPQDRERASHNTTIGKLDLEAIRYAIPAFATQDGTVRFITNAGGSTPGVTRHHVTVKFRNFKAMSNTATDDHKKSARTAMLGPLAMECDCGRWRYWFRYIATIGGYNAGRDERGFPKIRNPHLQGIACKHVIRVMEEIRRGTTVLGFLTRIMEKAKLHDQSKAGAKLGEAEADKLLKRMARRTTGHEVKTSTQRGESPASRAAKRTLEKAVPVKKPATASKLSTSKSLDQDQRIQVIRQQLQALGLPQAAIDAQIESIKATMK